MKRTQKVLVLGQKNLKVFRRKVVSYLFGDTYNGPERCDKKKSIVLSASGSCQIVLLAPTKQVLDKFLLQGQDFKQFEILNARNFCILEAIFFEPISKWEKRRQETLSNFR